MPPPPCPDTVARRSVPGQAAPPFPITLPATMDLIYRFDPLAPTAERECPDADAALERILSGNRRFCDVVEQIRQRSADGDARQPIVVPMCPLSLGVPDREDLPPGQSPFALVVGCSDARVPIETVLGQSLNELFVVRIAGNVLGVECLASVDFAASHFRDSLKLAVALGHTQCGAVSAAVDAYLSPGRYTRIAFTPSLRTLVDHLQMVVRGAATALREVYGRSVEHHPRYREALAEVAVYLNAAFTAHDLGREMHLSGDAPVRVVYTVYDLLTHRLHAFPDGAPHEAAAAAFAEAPREGEGFVALGRRIAQGATAATAAV